MNTRYIRNRIYIDPQEQEIIKNIPIVLGGSGIGSCIAECALRLGFENITIIDGDQVEVSNLNRQNYTHEDIASDKTAALKRRLLAINNNATITIHSVFINEDNIRSLITGHQIAINALDFTSDIPLLFDQICQENKIPVIHPYNLGWGGVATIIVPNGLSLNSIQRENERLNEVKIIEYVTSYMAFWGKPQHWIEDIIKAYKHETEPLPPPQLSVGSWLVASMCTNLLFDLAVGNVTKTFPEFYLMSISNS